MSFWTVSEAYKLQEAEMCDDDGGWDEDKCESFANFSLLL